MFANSLIPHGQLRIRIKQVGNFERNIGTWSLEAPGEDDFVGVDALGRKVSPEGVAAYESNVLTFVNYKNWASRNFIQEVIQSPMLHPS